MDVRCTATARSTGRQCGRLAQPGFQRCRYHQVAGERQEVDTFPIQGPADGAPGPGAAEALCGVASEIAMLRAMIRRDAQAGDLEAARRGIETLCRALKVQYALEGRAAEGLAGSLARVLDEVGSELNMSL